MYIGPSYPDSEQMSLGIFLGRQDETDDETHLKQFGNKSQIKSIRVKSLCLSLSLVHFEQAMENIVDFLLIAMLLQLNHLKLHFGFAITILLLFL